MTVHMQDKDINVDEEILKFARDITLIRMSQDKRIKYLKEKGLNDSQARKLLTTVEQDFLSEKKRKVNIIAGTIVLGLSTILVAILYFGITRFRFTFIIIPVGIIFFGLTLLIKGIMRYTSKNPIDDFD